MTFLADKRPYGVCFSYNCKNWQIILICLEFLCLIFEHDQDLASFESFENYLPHWTNFSIFEIFLVSEIFLFVSDLFCRYIREPKRVSNYFSICALNNLLFYVRLILPNIIVRKFPIGVDVFLSLILNNFIQCFRQCFDVRVWGGHTDSVHSIFYMYVLFWF